MNAMLKTEVLELAYQGTLEILKEWPTPLAGLMLARAALREEPLTDDDLAGPLGVPPDEVEAALQPLVDAGRVEKGPTGYAACPEWAHWTTDVLWKLHEDATEVVNGARE